MFLMMHIETLYVMVMLTMTATGAYCAHHLTQETPRCVRAIILAPALIGLAAPVLIARGHYEPYALDVVFAVSVSILYLMVASRFSATPWMDLRLKKELTMSMTYAQAREKIRTGDTVSIQTKTLGGYIIHALQIVAGCRYAWATHSAVALRLGDRLMVVEMSPAGNVMKPLSQYAGKRMAVSKPPLGTDLTLFDISLTRATENHIPYSLGDLIRIGLRLAPRRFIDTHGWGGDGAGDKVCSLLPALIYADMGGDVSAIPKLAAPAEIPETLGVSFEIVAANN